MNPTPSTTIASGAPFYRDDAGVWLPPIEWKSLKQWWDFLAVAVLVKPEIRAVEPPQGWLQVPSSVSVRRLCWAGQSRVSRRFACSRAARSILRSTDLVVARMPYYETAWLFRVAVKKASRLVLEIHGDWETAILEEDSSGLLRKATRRFRANLSSRVVREMAAYASCVLGVGPRLIEKYVPGHVPSFASTNHLLDEAEYRPRYNFELHQPPRILFVGEMKRRKGLHVLFKALGLLAKAGQPFEMVLVGTGPMTAELNQYAGQQGFSDRVRFVGAVPHGEQLFQHFVRSDVFVLPSVAAEGVPRVTHEAMAFGCPVIATDVGSVRWQLEGAAGVIVAPGDVEALARALRSVLADAALRCRLSGMGLQRSLQYTYDKQREGIARFVSSHVPQEYVRRSLTAAAS